MLLSQQILLRSVFLIITLSNIQTVMCTKKLNITLKAPGRTLGSTSTPHKSVHIRYVPTMNDKQQGTIVGFQPIIQLHQKAVQQMTVHLCDAPMLDSVWYDDENICDEAQSMLIYEWTPYSSSDIFRISDDCGFEFNEGRSIILTVIYQRERRLHKEQSGIILYISIQPPRFHMGTMIVGNKQGETHFSCRSANSPRLLYAVKNLNTNENKLVWRIDIIRVRYFGRKLVQSVIDSKMISDVNHSIEMTPSDLFFMKGDYLLIQCENPIQSNCHFLIYFIYKKQLLPNHKMCQNNTHESLFKLISSGEISNKNQTAATPINIDGSTIFLIVCLLLLITWISIIVGCIIMRRIRGLVNFRTEPTSLFTIQKNKLLHGGAQAPTDNYQRTGDIEHIMQVDADHGGLTG